MIDIGKHSKGILDFFMNSKHIALLGNHEYLMKDFLEGTNIYSYYDWLRTGGKEAVLSFMDNPTQGRIFENRALLFIDSCDRYERGMIVYNSEEIAVKTDPTLKALKSEIESEQKALRTIANSYIDQKYIDYIEQMPLFFETDELFVSHCPIPESISIKDLREKCLSKNFIDCIDNRMVSMSPKEKLIIFGHNSLQNPIKEYFEKEVKYAINIDSTKSNKLGFYNTLTQKVEFIDKF